MQIDESLTISVQGVQADADYVLALFNKGHYEIVTSNPLPLRYVHLPRAHITEHRAPTQSEHMLTRPEHEMGAPATCSAPKDDERSVGHF